MQTIIADIAGRQTTEATPDLLRRALRLDGRIAREDALAPLSPAERFACERIMAGACSMPASTGNVSMAFRPHGRLHVLTRDDFELWSDELTLVAHATLSDADLAQFLALRKTNLQQLELCRAEICAHLQATGFAAVCDELATIAEHMAPLLYYVGELCISNFYNVGKSAFPFERVLTDALRHVAEHEANADIAPLTAIYCLHLALRSGGYTRLEELNSTQLSLPALRQFFDDKRRLYDEVGGPPPDCELAGKTLPQQAIALATARGSIFARKRFIRLITGPSLRKREAVLPLRPVALWDDASVAQTASTYATLQRCLPSFGDARDLLSPSKFGQLLGPDLLPVDSPFASYLEGLIDRVIDEAARATRSDFAMTRSARHYRRFAAALRDGEAVLASAWSQAEYFCHVVPGPAMLRTATTKALAMTLNAISARMRFNSWHYAPSYFDTADVPSQRTWFSAPRMADIADDSDNHHTGHIQAVVRFSIRSPLPLCVNQKTLPGFIDLRLMRQSGSPYQQQDLVTAITYTEALQFLYQRLMDHVLAENADFVFSFGDKKWFDGVYSARPPVSQRAPGSDDLSAHSASLAQAII